MPGNNGILGSRAHLEPFGNPIESDSGLGAQLRHQRSLERVSFAPASQLLFRYTVPNLVNAWGVSFSATSPFWVSANGTGTSLLYAVTNDEHGMMMVSKLGLEVTIPGDGTPTGQVFNNVGGSNDDAFLFVSEDGTVSGWRSALGSAAEILTNRDGAGGGAPLRLA